MSSVSFFALDPHLYLILFSSLSNNICLTGQKRNYEVEGKVGPSNEGAHLVLTCDILGEKQLYKEYFCDVGILMKLIIILRTNEMQKNINIASINQLFSDSLLLISY